MSRDKARPIYRLIKENPDSFRLVAINPQFIDHDSQAYFLKPLGFPVQLEELGEPPYPVPLMKVQLGQRIVQRIESPGEDDELIAWLEPRRDAPLMAFFQCESLDQALALCETYDTFG